MSGITRAPIHPAGPALSSCCWGSWRCADHPETNTPDKLARLIEFAVELGISSFDLADIYGGYRVEPLFGAALRLTGVDRRTIQLISKADICPVSAARPGRRRKFYDTSRQHLRSSVQTSLEALQTDYLDLLLIHRPDPLMDADETGSALLEMVREGSIRYPGVSNFSPAQLDLLQSRMPLPLISNQVECSPLQLSPLFDGMLDQAQRLRMRPMIWSPLAGGRLFRPETEAEQRVVSALADVGERAGLAAAEVALAWLCTLPSRPIPVLGTGDRSRLAAQARATQRRLERQDWFQILEAAMGHPVP
jgi:predicted oxidoreductase